jgi:ubiquitin-conjugating enzyme E2 G1
MALKRLQHEYKQLLKEPNYLFSVEPDENNFFVWNVLLFGPSDSIFEGGIFKCQLNFPHEYPNKPPHVKIVSDIPHPNFYPDGRVCMSILHEGKDEYNYESLSERWMPSHTVSTILLSIIILLTAPNFDSPANIDISIEWRTNWDSYKKKIYKLIANS